MQGRPGTATLVAIAAAIAGGACVRAPATAPAAHTLRPAPTRLVAQPAPIVQAVAAPAPVPVVQAAAATTEIAAGAPYLVLDAATIAATGECRPYRPIFTVRAHVTNQGDAPSRPFPAVGMVGVRHPTMWLGWANGAGLPALPPGGSAEVTVPVFYPTADPSLARGRRTFVVLLNDYHWMPDAQVAPRRVPVTVDLTCAGAGAGAIAR